MSAALDAVVAQAVSSGAVPNLVVTVADRSGPIYVGASGPRSVSGTAPAGPDTVFWIASMTKVVTTVAALQLRERGLLDFDAPVAKYLPQWDELGVLDGFDGDTPILRAPATTATIAHLATHTSGLTYWFWNAAMSRYEAVTGALNVNSGSLHALTSPLIADPGTVFEYGTNTDWLGLAVEAASGQSLDTYVAEHIAGPLGMTDTTFLPGPAHETRLAGVHAPDGAGGWVDLGMRLPTAPDYWTGGHGLYSTPNDYLRFQRMLLGGGSLDGATLLRPDTVAEAFTPQIGDLTVPEWVRSSSPAHSCDHPYGPHASWGWGLLLNTVGQPGMRSAYSGGWSGLANTHFWVDPAAGITAALYSQFLPFVTPASLQVYAEVERAVYASR